MPKKRRDVVDKETLFLSMHLMLDRCLKALSMRSNYESICDDIRSLSKLTQPVCEAIMKKKTYVEGDANNRQ